jgi:hypothetical protein
MAYSGGAIALNFSDYAIKNDAPLTVIFDYNVTI